MKKTLYRALTLLVSVALLLSLASPAFATTTTDTFLATSLPADIVISSAMNGIGVLPAADPVPYEGIVSRVKNWLTEQGKVIDDKIEVWKRSVVSEGQWQYGADVSLIEAIRSWLFDEDVVTSSYDLTVSTTTWNGNHISWTLTSGVGFTPITIRYLSNSGTYSYVMYLVSDSSFQFQRDSNGTITEGIRSYHTSGLYWRDVESTTYLDRVYSGFPIVHTVVLPQGVSTIAQNRFDGYIYSSSVTSTYDLRLGHIPSGSVVFGDAYPTWYGNTAVIPLPGSVGGSDDEKVYISPIAPGNTLSDTFGKTQEQVWTGQSSYTESVPDAGTGSLADVIAAIVAIPSQIINGLKDLFIPNISNLTFPLQNFFPFCIPFDLYEFFTLLSASPEAPVFEWEIPVPQLGRTFELKVDLSPWNDVATLFRNLELLAFIVGLAYVTREKFLRS